MTRDAGVERATSTAIAAFSSESEKNCRFPSLAMIQRVASCTADLDLGLGESRQLQAVWVRPASRCGSRTPFIRCAVARSR